MSRIVTTASKLVSDLKTLESRPNYYNNHPPYNLCYVHSDGRTSADCVNLYKSLLNGYDISNRTPGYFQGNLSNTGDVDGWTLLNKCSDVSTDFSKLKNGEPRLLYMVHGKDWHVGGFVGEFQKYGRTYNVVECTAAWNAGILFSWVDSKGNRYKSKGGEARSSWTHHGLMNPWVDYREESYPPYIYNGVDYAPVFDAAYYSNKYEDLKKVYGTDTTQLFLHFIRYGMKECRQADEEFNVITYKNNYADLRDAYGDDYPLYYYHYCRYGKKEGRVANMDIYDGELKPIDEIAKEVIAGKWGVGEERKRRLTNAGYDYKKVQQRVNELMNC